MGLLKVGTMIYAVAALACGVALPLTAMSLENRLVSAVVTSVIDGDTIKVQLSEGPALVRLANIDAPESIQSGGGAAIRALHARILGQDVSLQVIDRDRDQRLVAVVFLGDENVNAWMVKQGHAWADRGSALAQDYCVWEKAARSLRRGLWADKHWVAPWDWRISQRDALHFVTDYTHASAAGCLREIGKLSAFDD
ncbi:MAG TPA: thermonuclease family protein [Steroidobacteraceae bacterium]|nr:thermonuclease family protein [Steroidobacteraceae bacterium]